MDEHFKYTQVNLCYMAWFNSKKNFTHNGHIIIHTLMLVLNQLIVTIIHLLVLDL